MMNKIFCLGLGKLGLIFSYILCDSGYKIYGYDKNPKIKDDIINNANNIEPKLNELIRRNKKNFFYVEEFGQAVEKTSSCILVLPTPSKRNHEFDNSYIFETLKKIGNYLKFKKKYIINITSTVNPGSCHLFIKFLEEKFLLKHGKEFIITYNPHLIALGQIYNDVINAELVIIGSDLSYGHTYLKKFYSKIYKKNFGRLKFLNLKEAEITKISINAFVTLKISFSNTLSQVADTQKNIDISKIVSVVGSDSRIGKKYLGLGGSYSGPCFPRDSLNFSTYLKKVNAKNYIPLAVEKINQYQIRRYLKLFKTFSKKFKKKPIVGICGISYKKNTTVTDFSPGMQILKKLINKNKIIIYDEYKISNSLINKNNIINYSSIKKFFNKADIIFVCYINEKFKDLKKFKSKNKKIIIDLWNFLNIKSSKITYKSLGVS